MTAQVTRLTLLGVPFTVPYITIVANTVFLGTIPITKFYLGSISIPKIYLGSTEIV